MKLERIDVGGRPEKERMTKKLPRSAKKLDGPHSLGGRFQIELRDLRREEYDELRDDFVEVRTYIVRSIYYVERWWGEQLWADGYARIARYRGSWIMVEKDYAGWHTHESDIGLDDYKAAGCI